MQDTWLNPQNMGMLGLVMVLALGVALVKPTVGLALVAGFFLFLLALGSMQTALYLLIVSMLCSPEIAIGGAVGKGVGGRMVTFRLEDLLLIVMGLGWLAKIAMDKNLPLFKWTPLNGPILYYILACILSTMIGVLTGDVKPKAGFFYVLKYFEYFFIFFMVVNHVTTKSQVVKCLIVIVLTCVGASLFGITQIPSGERATLPFEGSSGEPNTFGGYLVLMMALVGGLLLHLESFPLRVALMGLLGCMVLTLLATHSRSSYIAVAVLAVMVMRFQWKNPKIIGMVLVGMMGMVLMVPADVKERIFFTIEQRKHPDQFQVGGLRLDTSTSARIRGWKKGFNHWIQRPLLGKGVASTWWADVMYMKVLAETGLIGLTAFLFLMVRLWQTTKATFLSATTPWEKGLTFGFLMSIVPLLVHALGANTFTIVRIMEPFWFLAALVVLLQLVGGGRVTERDGHLAVSKDFS